MKTIVYREYGEPDVMELADMPKPTVGDGDVLIRSHAASVNQIDLHFLNGLVPVWLVLLVAAGTLGAGAGWLQAAASSEDLEDTSAGLAIEMYGEPQAFWLTDGPGTPGGDDDLRVEQWLYPDAGVALFFYDGQLAVEDQVTFSQDVPVTQISPTSLGKWMARGDVESMLGEQGQPLGNANSPYPGTEAYAYPMSHLLIGYLDGMFLSAQTY